LRSHRNPQISLQVLMLTLLYLVQDWALIAALLSPAGRSLPMDAYVSVRNTYHPGHYNRAQNKDLQDWKREFALKLNVAAIRQTLCVAVAERGRVAEKGNSCRARTCTAQAYSCPLVPVGCTVWKT